ncbi:uncharacterized protein LOC112341774 [Selaginella moellendorffii]|uniref:uncharacterized protein LOC112341774 n=1 Tax=Selaginella moellendorffii TaxID=88036 RepID=UPI000D1C541B|nr:uncharacterized protein LOC112341774 [Selaginella moellendorffii]|eukprot:XP_024518227.1 uncharacterized protein LOC112341774 [Selaginella moellendorffii]
MRAWPQIRALRGATAANLEAELPDLEHLRGYRQQHPATAAAAAARPRSGGFLGGIPRSASSDRERDALLGIYPVEHSQDGQLCVISLRVLVCLLEVELEYCQHDTDHERWTLCIVPKLR